LGRVVPADVVLLDGIMERRISSRRTRGRWPAPYRLAKYSKPTVASTNPTIERPNKPIPANRRTRAQPVARQPTPCLGSLSLAPNRSGRSETVLEKVPLPAGY
jgi:hypothetical protein